MNPNHNFESVTEFKAKVYWPMEKRLKELEEENARLNKELLFISDVQTPDYERVQKELWQYQKALDKACKYLETYDRKGNYAKIGLTVNEWKEWCLKDE